MLGNLFATSRERVARQLTWKLAPKRTRKNLQREQEFATAAAAHSEEVIKNNLKA